MTPLEIALSIACGAGVPWAAWLSYKVIRIDAKVCNGITKDVGEIKRRQNIQSDSIHELRERCARNHPQTTTERSGIH